MTLCIAKSSGEQQHRNGHDMTKLNEPPQAQQSDSLTYTLILHLGVCYTTNWAFEILGQDEIDGSSWIIEEILDLDILIDNDLKR